MWQKGEIWKKGGGRNTKRKEYEKGKKNEKRANYDKKGKRGKCLNGKIIESKFILLVKLISFEIFQLQPHLLSLHNIWMALQTWQYYENCLTTLINSSGIRLTWLCIPCEENG